MSGALSGLKAIKNLGYELIIVSNQYLIDEGFISQQDYDQFTLKFESVLADIKIPLDANGDNEYEIIVQADDNTVSVTHTSEQTITVKPAGCSFFTIPTGGGKIVVICL